VSLAKLPPLAENFGAYYSAMAGKPSRGNLAPLAIGTKNNQATINTRG